MTFEDAVREYRDGNLNGLELRHAALVGLTLANVHVRMGVPEVRHVVGKPQDFHRVGHRTGPRTNAWHRVALVLRTWSRPPPGGWLRAPTAWQRLLDLESSIGGESAERLGDDRVDPEPAIRAWAVVACDTQKDFAGLLSALDDPDPDVRLLAAAALVERKASDDHVREVLRALLGSERCSAEAVAVLAPFRDPLAAPLLLDLYEATHREDVLAALAFKEALPILERELVEGASWSALQAVEALGPDAGPIWQAVMAKLSKYADAITASGHGDTRSSNLFGALIAIGDAAAAAGPDLLRWGARQSQSFFDTFERSAATAAGAVSHDARIELAQWLSTPDPVMRRRALAGLAAGKAASWQWRAAITELLNADDDETAVDAAVALACIGDTRGARDAWLSFEAWPLNHHLSYPGLHRLADLLIRDLPGVVDLSDPQDVARTIQALETAGVRTRDAWSSVALVVTNQEAEARRAAGEALEALKKRLGPPHE